MEEPDYPNYSLEELRDAQRHVDDQRYPDRAAAIEREIGRRRQEAEVEPDRSTPPVPQSQEVLSKRTVGAFLAVSGVISLARSLDLLKLTGGFVAAPAILVLVICYGGMVVAGVCLWKRWHVGPLIGLFAVALQIPIIQVGRFLYMVTAVPTLEIKLWPSFGFYFAQFNALNMTIYDTPQAFYLGINAIAATLAAILLEFYRRQQAALARLESRKRKATD